MQLGLHGLSRFNVLAKFIVELHHLTSFSSGIPEMGFCCLAPSSLHRRSARRRRELRVRGLQRRGAACAKKYNVDSSA